MNYETLCIEAECKDAVPSAEFSECEEHEQCGDPFCRGRRFRYLLRYPTCCVNDRVCLFILANPSTATPEAMDPTVTRAVGYAGGWGYGWCWVANVRAWRETNPKLVPPDPRAIGPDNERGEYVLELVRSIGKAQNALKLNRDRSPAHPLYLRGDLKPFEMP
jgi:hypothetical protein